MKLFEATTFHKELLRLQAQGVKDFTNDELYKLRLNLSDYYASGHCTVGVFQLFSDLIKQAIYKKSLEE